MKKNFSNIIAFMLFLLTGGVAGVFMATASERLLPEGASTLQFFQMIAVFIWVLILALVVQTAIHEAGHWLFGRLTGYRFVSYRLYSLMWLNDGRSTRFRRYSLAGTGGQCLMEPPEMVNGELPVTLYNLGGALLNLMASAVFALLAVLLREQPVAWALFAVLAAAGVGFALVNGIPMRLNLVDNDGMNALELRRNPAARRAFWIQLKIAAGISRDRTLNDMPGEWFALPKDEDMDNSLVASLAAFAANRLMEAQDFDGADALMARALMRPGAMPGIHQALLTGDRIFCELVGANRPEAVDALLTKNQRKMMKAMKGQLAILRTQYALARLHDRDDRAAALLDRRLDAAFKTYPYPQEAEGERRLVALVKEKARG